MNTVVWKVVLQQDKIKAATSQYRLWFHETCSVVQIAVSVPHVVHQGCVKYTLGPLVARLA